MFNYSFWADEAGIATVAKQWVTEKISLVSAFNSSGITYQKLQIIIEGVFFKLFGISEFSARLPSLLSYFIGLIIIFLLAKRLSNIYAGIISAFLYGFSHLNLAYATQAKPYMMVQAIALTGIFFIVKTKNEKSLSNLIYYHTVVIILFSFATFIHQIGVFLWALYFSFVIYQLFTSKFLKLKFLRRFKISYFFYIFVACLFLFFSLKEILTVLLNGLSLDNIFRFNHSYQVIKLFAYKYSLISLCSLLGFIWIYKKYKDINTGIFLYSIIVFISVTFIAYIFNIRYVFSLFGIMFLYFGIFWAKVGERYLPKKPWVIPLIIILLLYATGYKIVRWPQAYYSPNIDKYGDVQIANYKDFYQKLKMRFPDYKNLYIVNDLYDTESWYMSRYSDAYFMKFTDKPYKHHTANAVVYGSLADFKREMAKHDKGLLIMEDWESFLPEDIKQYAKRNLKLEFRVESLKEAPDDPWPLALYSWGMP